MNKNVISLNLLCHILNFEEFEAFQLVQILRGVFHIDGQRLQLDIVFSERLVLLRNMLAAPDILDIYRFDIPLLFDLVHRLLHLIVIFIVPFRTRTHTGAISLTHRRLLSTLS